MTTAANISALESRIREPLTHAEAAMTQVVLDLSDCNSVQIRLIDAAGAGIKRLARQFDPPGLEQYLDGDAIEDISHELRTPLTAAQGALEMLHDGDAGQLPSKLAEPTDQALDSIMEIVSIVTAFLETEEENRRSDRESHGEGASQ